ncbi:VOC family protein [Chloroflexota bacterium]
MPNYWYDHVHLVSPAPLETAHFYEKMFSAERVSTTELADGRTSVVLDLNGSSIRVIDRQAQAEPAPSETGYGLGHFGIITDDLEAAVAELKINGVQFREDIRVVGPKRKTSFLWGPENVLIELVERSG